MLYILTGLVSATLFGVAVVTVYGHEGLLDHPWIEYVFWWLIGTGVGLALLENIFRLICKLCKHLPAVPVLCDAAPCPG